MPVPYVMLRAAIDGGQLDRVRLLAKDMPPMKLDDALRVLFLMRGLPDYEAAVVRWMGRFAVEGKGVTPTDLSEALSYLRDLPNEPSLLEDLLQLAAERGVGRAT